MGDSRWRFTELRSETRLYILEVRVTLTAHLATVELHQYHVEQHPSTLCQCYLGCDLSPSHNDDRSDGQNHVSHHDGGLCAKDRSDSIALDPGGLEIAHRESTRGAPSIDDGRDHRRLLGIFLQRIGGNGSKVFELE